MNGRATCPLIGCTTAGEIATAGPGGASVVVTALGGSGFAVRTAVATEASGTAGGGSERGAERCPVDADLPHKVAAAAERRPRRRPAGSCPRRAWRARRGSTTRRGLRGRRPEDEPDMPALRRPRPVRLGGRGWHRLERTARHRRPSRLAEGRRADARDVQHGATASTPSTTGPRSTPTSSVSASPNRRSRTRGADAACAHPPARPGPPERRGSGVLHRRRRLR